MKKTGSKITLSIFKTVSIDELRVKVIFSVYYKKNEKMWFEERRFHCINIRLYQNVYPLGDLLLLLELIKLKQNVLVC